MAMSPQLDRLQRRILDLHREMFEESPSPMKLQKLCYYAQGYMLAQGNELFPEDFQAWQHGPVIPELYQRYRDYKWRAITDEVSSEPLDEGNDEEVREIVAAYGRYDGAALSTMTHRESPWIDARGGLADDVGSRAVITKESLRNYFLAQL